MICAGLLASANILYGNLKSEEKITAPNEKKASENEIIVQNITDESTKISAAATKSVTESTSKTNTRTTAVITETTVAETETQTYTEIQTFTETQTETAEIVTESIPEPNTEEIIVPRGFDLHEEIYIDGGIEEVDKLVYPSIQTYNLAERHRTADTDYYTNLMINSSKENLDTLENKSYIYHMMLNTFEYFDTVKGTVRTGNQKAAGIIKTEFASDIMHQYAMEKAYKNAIDENPTGINCLIEGDRYGFDMIAGTFDITPVPSLLVDEENPQLFTYEKVPDNHIKVKYDGDNICEKAGQDLSNLFYARIAVYPIDIALKELAEFEEWNIVGTTEFLGRPAVICKGEKKKYNFDFEVIIDLQTGIILSYRNYTINSGELVYIIEMDEIEVDVPLEIDLPDEGKEIIKEMQEKFNE